MSYQLVDTSGARVEGDELKQRLARLDLAQRRATWRDQGHKVPAPKRAPYGYVKPGTKRAPRLWGNVAVAIGGTLFALGILAVVVSMPGSY